MSMPLFLAVLSFFLVVTEARSSLRLMLEGGVTVQTRNDVQIPPSSGTLVAADQFEAGLFAHYRMEAFYHLNQHHALRAVVAPLSLTLTGQTPFPVSYNQQNFSANQDLEIRYQFNSYRLGYVYALLGFKDSQLNLGLTLKIREADIRFRQGSVETSYDNVGLVPLFYFEYQTPLSERWLLNVNVDAAAASQGRAIDAALKLRRKFSDHSSLGWGLRTLEGGADNDKVKTFSWLHYAVLDLSVTF